MDTPDVPAALRLLDPAETEGLLRLDEASYFLSRIELQRGDAPTMARWRKRLFIATAYIAADAGEHFSLPRDRTVVTGSHIDVQPESTRQYRPTSRQSRVSSPSREVRGGSCRPA